MEKRALAAANLNSAITIISILILLIAFSTATEARVVGEITDNQGKFFGPPDHICDDVNTISDTMKVESGGQQASWDCQTASSPHRPYYTIGADQGTQTFTLTPPSGYECGTWGVNYPSGGATNTGGTGCSATITALNGDWSTHLWFFVKLPTPQAQAQCNDNDGDKYSNCPPKACGTGGTATSTPSGTGSCDIQGLDRERTDLDTCSRTQSDCDTVTTNGGCQVKTCAKGWKNGDTNVRYGNFRTGTNCRVFDMDDRRGPDCDDDLKMSYRWSVSGDSITITTQATRHEADGVIDAGYTLEALNCEFSDGALTKEEKVFTDLPSDSIQTAQRSYTVKSCPTTAQDCDDANPIINPGSNNPYCNCNDGDGKKPEAEKCDGVDNDCDTLIDEGYDNDGDGYTPCSGTIDCDDNDATIYPGAPEKCDAKDHNCNGNPYDGVDPDSCEELCNSGIFQESRDEQQIIVRAKGENGNGWPAMQLWVDRQKVSEWTVDSAEFKSYTATVPSFRAGQEVAVAFPNDYYSASPLVDRNLVVDYVQIGSMSVQAEDTSRTTYDKGDSSATYFDNKDTVSPDERRQKGALEKMPWAGALRITDTSPSSPYTWLRGVCCGDDKDEHVKESADDCGTGCCGSTECYDASTKGCVASGKTAGDKYCYSGMWTDRSLVAMRIIDYELSYKSEKFSELCGTYEEALNTYNYPILGRLAADYFKEPCMVTNRDGPCANELCVAEIDGKVFVAGSLNFEPQPSELKAMFNYDKECKAPFATDRTTIKPCNSAPDKLWYSKKTGIFVYGSEEFTLRFDTESDEFEQFLDHGTFDPELGGKVYVYDNQDQERTIFGFLSPPMCGFDGTAKEEIQVTYMKGFATDICKATAHLGEGAECNVYESPSNRKTYKISSARNVGEYNSYFEAWLDLTAKLKVRKACPENCACDEFNDVIECPAGEHCGDFSTNLDCYCNEGETKDCFKCPPGSVCAVADNCICSTAATCTTDKDCKQPLCPVSDGGISNCPTIKCISGQCTSVSQPACTDSDGGREIYTKGTAATSAETMTDSCTNFRLTEYTCNADGTIGQEGVNCPLTIDGDGGCTRDGGACLRV